VKRYGIITILGVITVLPCQAKEFALHEDDYAERDKKYSPYVDEHFPKNVYFGDTHLHTSWSADAGLGGPTLGPEFADRVARVSASTRSSSA